MVAQRAGHWNTAYIIGGYALPNERERLAQRLDLTPATISFHLKKLADAGAVRSYKTQYYTMYALEPGVFEQTILSLLQEESAEADLQAQRDEASFYQLERTKRSLWWVTVVLGLVLSSLGVALAVLAALLIWAGSRFSTGMVRLMGFLDIAAEDADTRFVDENLDIAPTLPPEEFVISDQDYDAVSAEAEAQEEVRTPGTDYLTDGDEMLPVDQTAEELAED